MSDTNKIHGSGTWRRKGWIIRNAKLEPGKVLGLYRQLTGGDPRKGEIPYEICFGEIGRATVFGLRSEASANHCEDAGDEIVDVTETFSTGCADAHVIASVKEQGQKTMWTRKGWLVRNRNMDTEWDHALRLRVIGDDITGPYYPDYPPIDQATVFNTRQEAEAYLEYDEGNELMEVIVTVSVGFTSVFDDEPADEDQDTDSSDDPPPGWSSGS